MNAVIKAVSSKVLGLFISDLKAGACVPQFGERCKHCASDHLAYHWYFACDGHCSKSTVHC